MLSIKFSELHASAVVSFAKRKLIEKFAFGDRTIPIHARTRGFSVPPQVMGMYYGTVQSAVVHTYN